MQRNEKVDNRASHSIQAGDPNPTNQNLGMDPVVRATVLLVARPCGGWWHAQGTPGHARVRSRTASSSLPIIRHTASGSWGWNTVRTCSTIFSKCVRRHEEESSCDTKPTTPEISLLVLLPVFIFMCNLFTGTR
jgi:hypothetical protein